MRSENPFENIDPFLKTLENIDENKVRVIMMGIALDELLGTLLSKSMVNKSIYKCLEKSGDSGFSLSYKNKLAYAFGLIPKEIFKDIDVIRRLRNNVAHQNVVTIPKSDIQKTYSSLNVVKLVDELRQSHRTLEERLCLAFGIICVYLIKKINRTKAIKADVFDVNTLGYDELDAGIYSNYLKNQIEH